ncbi:hypothetical protein Micbo1qcDRAFT_207859 [Microdochium bolleyi]|uniref:Uncharacterized protein n=1 Tax=Microdochium bolleyi TaxID=196109 RepID=A0A136IS09_9PEZI|nr:hypothetical protein Micbo1qcDRAFT_207859 [Microdochium bolleyi]
MVPLAAAAAAAAAKRNTWIGYWSRLLRSWTESPNWCAPDRVLELKTDGGMHVLWLTDTDDGDGDNEAGAETARLHMVIRFGWWLPITDDDDDDDNDKGNDDDNRNDDEGGDSITVFRLHHDDEVYQRPGVLVLEALMQLAREDPFKLHILKVSGREERQPAAKILFHLMEEEPTPPNTPVGQASFPVGLPDAAADTIE